MRFVSWIIMVPVAVAVVTFSLNNRERVPVDIWPVPFTVDAPIFAIVLISILTGMVIGAVLAWLSGGRTRRRARTQTRRAETAERQAATLRDQLSQAEPGEEPKPSQTTLPARADAA